MKKVILFATAVALLGLILLTFAMCEGPANPPKSPSYLPQS